MDFNVISVGDTLYSRMNFERNGIKFRVNTPYTVTLLLVGSGLFSVLAKDDGKKDNMFTFHYHMTMDIIF